MAQFITHIELYMLQINRFAKDKLRVIFLEVFNLGILKCLLYKAAMLSFLTTGLITQIGFL